MCARKMHSAEVETDVSLVGRLLATLARKKYLILGIAFMAASFFAFMTLLESADLSFAVPASAATLVFETILARIVLSHPARQHKSDAAALAEASHHRAGDPVVAQAAHRSDERIAVGGEGEGAVHGLADADAAERGEVFEANFEVGRESFKVLRQQLHGEVVRRLLGRPDDAVRFVSADERAAALLAHVDLTQVIGGVDDLLRPALKLR